MIEIIKKGEKDKEMVIKKKKKKKGKEYSV
jgi:hypothetical protein